MYIVNDSSNYVRKQYTDGWDFLREYYTYDDGGEYWLYVYDANGNHPTVSGSGAKLTAGAGNDYIYNLNGNSLSINAGDGDNTIRNYDGNNVTITFQQRRECSVPIRRRQRLNQRL